MKNILNISRLHQNELWHIIKMLPDEPTKQYIITGYNIIDPNDNNLQKNITTNEYEQILLSMDDFSPGITILETYTKENVLSPDIVNNINIIDANTVPFDLATSNKYDLVVIGISDTGVDIFKKIKIMNDIFDENSQEEYSQLQILSDARDAGIPIIFTHDCLEINSFVEPFPDDYNDLVHNFGIDINNINNINIQTNSISCINPTHDIMTAYYTLDNNLEIQPTHNGGLSLLPSATIIYSSSNENQGLSNYYLATFEEPEKGKIVICNIGHCYGNHNQFFRPAINECKILVNSIIWTLQ